MRRRLFTRRGRRAAEAPCAECAQEGVRPFGLVVEPEPMVHPDDVLVRTPGRLETVIDGQLLVFAPGDGRTHLLNASAALVLTSVDGTARVADIIDDLSRETGAERTVLASDVIDTCARFVHGGLVTWSGIDGTRGTDGGAGGPRGAADRTSRGESVIAERLDGLDWPFVLGPYQAVETPVIVRADDPEVASALADALGSMPATTGPHAAAVSVDTRRVRGDTRHRVHAGGSRIGWADGPEPAVGLALAGLNLVAAAEPGTRIMFHAGAVERDGQVIAIAGPSGRGKSTLTAALIQRGFNYVTDEIVAVDPTDRSVLAYPKALELDAGALSLLGLSLDPDGPGATHDEALARRRVASISDSREHHVAPTTLGGVSTGGRLALFVLLDDPISGAEAATVEPGPAMIRLLSDVFPETWSRPGALDGLADLCSRVSATSLPRLGFDEAADLLSARL